MDAVKAYRSRRDARIKARADAEEGRWVTTENDHKVHFNEQGEPDKGNPHVLAAMSGGKKNAPEPFSEIGKEAGDWAKKNGYKAVFIPDYKNKKGEIIQKGHYVYSDKYGRTVSAQDIKEKAMGDGKKTSGSDQDKIAGYGKKEPETMESDMEKQGYKKNAEGRWEKEENKEYGYGSGDVKKTKSEQTPGTYESLPFSLKKNGLTKEEKKQVRDTITRFMNEAKTGDVYVVGGGVGSSNGQKFEVTTYRGGKPALKWVGSSWNPVLMSRENVEKFIRNGAKRVDK